ncbi:hypothetical protein [Paenibacillus borealis]|uniref:hypothetical protein n=1 Tax=Paenibacillus borealis TaxID=160799 RepID=UPI00273FE3EA|nr:hypothetical protein [Paenibacillus borealis]
MASPILDRRFPALRIGVLSGGDPGLLAEAAAEIIFIREANLPGDFPQGFGGVQ